MSAMRKAKAEAKEEEKAEKELAKSRIQVAHEVRMAREAEAEMDHHVNKAAKKVDLHGGTVTCRILMFGIPAIQVLDIQMTRHMTAPKVATPMPTAAIPVALALLRPLEQAATCPAVHQLTTTCS
ncbi:hypothetical protein Pfo_001541, partial [Paulownia fortunei]